MTERKTVPEYGAEVKIEDAPSFYLRERALDAIQEQAVEDLNAALAQLNGRGVLVGTDYEAIGELQRELSNAADLARVVWELAFAKRPEDDEA